MLIDKYTYRDTILKDIFIIHESDYCGELIWKIEYNWEKIWKIDDFSKMESCQQNPKYHKEGNVKEHTIKVCEEALKICDSEYYSSVYKDRWIVGEENLDKTFLLLTAALFHDIGKTVTTKLGKDGNWHSYNHEIEGEKITRKLLWDTGCYFREEVCALVRYHMMPLGLFERKNYMEEIARICSIVPSWNLLVYLKQCDLAGSIHENDAQKQTDYMKLNEIRTIGNAIDRYVLPHIGYRRHNFEYYNDSVNKKNINLIVMIGLPGSGKDTYIEKEFKNNHTVILCRDDIRTELGYCNQDEKIVGTSEQEKEVTRIFNERMLNAAKMGKDIVINNINLKKEYRDNYTKMLSNYNLNITYYYIEATSLEKNIERRNGQISKEVFYNMIEKFEWPIKQEYDHLFVARN